MDDRGNENARPGNESGRARVLPEMKSTRSFEIDDAAWTLLRKPSLQPYIDAGLQLIPLHRWNVYDAKKRPRGKTPRDGAWQAREYDSNTVADAAERDGINVGVRLPASVMVLDVDPRNFGGGDSLLALMIDTGMDLRRVPQTATGSGGSHYWFSKPIDVQLLDSLDAYPGVEFKSLGRQVVSAGSKHPNGVVYTWVGEPPNLRELPDIPASLLEMIRRPVRAHGEAAGLGELTPLMLAETLEQLEPTDFGEHDEWLNLMMACHHATNGEGRLEFIDWSTGDAKYADDAWIIGRRWDSLDKEAGNGGRPITIKYLHKVVQAHGGQVAQVAPEDDFEAWEPEEDLGAGVDDTSLRAEPVAIGLDSVMEQLNAKHAVVMEGGKFRIFTEQYDPVIKRPFFQRSTKDDFCNLYTNDSVELPGGRVVSKAQVWLKHPARRQYEGIIFDPERNHDDWLNLWRGWSVAPKPGDWSLLKELLLDVLVDGDLGHYEYVMNWMAYMFQRPGDVAEVAIAFRGEKGTGKGTLGRALAKLAGTHGLHISSPEHLVGRFNSHLQNCVCLFADEAFWAGNTAGESVLKQLVTEPTLTYEGKGRDAVMGKNYVHLMMASNNDWVVPAGLDGERRFAVFAVNNKRKQDKPFFRALNAQLDNGGLAAMLHELLARPLDGWHPRDNVPQTRALAEQKELSMSPAESWWDDVLSSGESPMPFAEPDEWTNGSLTLKPDLLHTHYVDYVRKHSMGRSMPVNALAMAIRKKAGIERQQIKGKWFWIVPQIDKAREIWAKTLGVG